MLQWDITKENCIKRIIICFIEMDLIIKFGVLCRNARMKQRCVTSMTCKNA